MGTTWVFSCSLTNDLEGAGLHQTVCAHRCCGAETSWLFVLNPSPCPAHGSWQHLLLWDSSPPCPCQSHCQLPGAAMDLGSRSFYPDPKPATWVVLFTAFLTHPPNPLPTFRNSWSPCPGQVSKWVGTSSHTPKGGGFNSWSGHICRL